MKRGVKTNPDNIDPETGLSWYQSNLREQALEKRRKNEIAEKLEKREYLQADSVKSVFATLVGALEQIPGKLKSELGLTAEQTARIQRILDDARAQAAEKILEK